MRKLLLIVYGFGLCLKLKSQSPDLELEMNAYVKFDSYPEISYRPNSSMVNTAKITGFSPGLNIILRTKRKHFSITGGVGYYKFSFDKIRHYSSLFGEGTARTIEGYNPPGPLAPSLSVCHR